MDGQRWWIIEEIARWWRQAPEEERFVLMRRVIDGAPEATHEEVCRAALLAETQIELPDDASREVIEAWSFGKGIGRR